MGFEKNEIEMCIANMHECILLYEKIEQAKRLQGYEPELAIAVAVKEAWKDAVAMIEEAYAKYHIVEAN